MSETVIYDETVRERLENTASFFGANIEELFPPIITQSEAFLRNLPDLLELMDESGAPDFSLGNPYFRLILILKLLQEKGYASYEEVLSSTEEGLAQEVRRVNECFREIEVITEFIGEEIGAQIGEWSTGYSVVRNLNISTWTVEKMAQAFLSKIQEFGISPELFFARIFAQQHQREITYYSPVLVREIRNRVEVVRKIETAVREGRLFQLNRLADLYPGCTPYHEFTQIVAERPSLIECCVMSPALSNPDTEKPTDILMTITLWNALVSRLESRRKLPEKGENVQNEFTSRDLRIGGEKLAEAFQQICPDLTEEEIMVLTVRVSDDTIRRAIRSIESEAYPRRVNRNETDPPRRDLPVLNTQLADLLETGKREGLSSGVPTTLFSVWLAFEIRTRIAQKIHVYPKIEEVKGDWYTYSDFRNGNIPDLDRRGRGVHERTLRFILSEIVKCQNGYSIKARAKFNNVTRYYSVEAFTLALEILDEVSSEIAILPSGEMIWISQIHKRRSNGYKRVNPKVYARRRIASKIGEIGSL